MSYIISKHKHKIASIIPLTRKVINIGFNNDYSLCSAVQCCATCCNNLLWAEMYCLHVCGRISAGFGWRRIVNVSGLLGYAQLLLEK